MDVFVIEYYNLIFMYIFIMKQYKKNIINHILSIYYILLIFEYDIIQWNKQTIHRKH
jgi:hypothetical protein